MVGGLDALRPAVTRPTAALLIAATAFTASSTPARAQAPGRPSRYALSARVVDSVRSVDEEIRRFRSDIPVAPTKLIGGAATAKALVRQFVEALARSDTSALVGMAATRAEFAYLLYPSSPYTRAPYRQSPEIAWLLLQAENQKGLTRLLRRLGGREAIYDGHRCGRTPLREGRNRIWRGCRVRLRLAAGESFEGRLFGAIVEREGRFKFASYATDF
jgi:hypothetical protein